MKFTVNADDIKTAFNKTVHTLHGKCIMPILETFMVDVKGSEATITATNLETGVRTKIPVTADEEIKFVIDGKIATDLINKLDGDLQFSVEVLNKTPTKLEIKSKNGKYKLSVSESGDFPEFQFDYSGQWFEIDTEAFLSAIKFTEGSISREDIRPAMAGLLIQLEKGELKFVSTDGHKLSLCKINDFENVVGELIIPRDGLLLLKKIPLKEKIKFCPQQSMIGFASGDDIIATRLIGERFPDYKRVIPIDNDKTAVMDREKAHRAIRRLMLLETDGKTVSKIAFNFSKDKTSVSLQSSQQENDGTEVIDCNYTGEELKIAFNGTYLNQMLGTFGSEKIVFEMRAPRSAIIMRESKQEENFMLLMPIQLEG